VRLESFTLHPHLRAAFTGREEGNQASHTGADPDAVAGARALVASGLGFPPERLRYLHQVHSARVAAPAGPGGIAPEADAMADVTGDLAPVVLTADCVPVLIAASGPDGVSRLGVAHAGRRGLLDGVVPAAADALLRGGGERLEAWIGPSICAGCYEVPAAMRNEAQALLPGIAASTTWGTPSLDLVGAVAAQLRAIGALVHVSGACTLEDPSFFSYRGGDLTARNASLIWAA